MKASTYLIPGVLVALALGGCKEHGDEAQLKTKFPGMVTAGGGTSGQVMAAHGGPKTDATYAGGTPFIAGGAGGNTSGAGTGGTTTETGQGPSAGVSNPGAAAGTTQQQTGDNRPAAAAPTPESGNSAPQPAAAHRDQGASQAAPGR